MYTAAPSGSPAQWPPTSSKFGLLSLELQTVGHSHTSLSSRSPCYGLLSSAVGGDGKQAAPPPATDPVSPTFSLHPNPSTCKIKKTRDFPGGPVVRTLRFHCRGSGSIPGQGTKILQAAKPKQKKQKNPDSLAEHEGPFSASFSTSIHVLPGFTLTHLLLPKYNLLFQASKPFLLLFLLPRRGLSLFSYPENSYLDLKIMPKVTPIDS